MKVYEQSQRISDGEMNAQISDWFDFEVNQSGSCTLEEIK